MKKSFIFLLFAALFFSCSKNEALLQLIDSQKIIEFKNFEELSAHVEKVSKMNTEERLNYEHSLGYESFGTKSESIYFEFLKKDSKSNSDVEKFVSENEQWIDLRKEEGELICEPKLANNSYRYVINKDKIFKIGHNILKVYNDGVLVFDEKFISELYKLDVLNLSDLKVDSANYSKFYSQTIVSEIEDRDLPYNCGTYTDGRQTNGSNRTFMKLEIEFGNVGGLPHVKYLSLVRPYKRILGIWYFCERTISCDVKFAVDTKAPDNTWSRAFYTHTETKHAYAIEKTYFYSGYGYDQFWHFGGYDSWGDTPDTNPVVLQCNTSLF